MRTTLTLEPDVAAKLSNCTARLKRPTKAVVNEALRIGLEKLAEPAQAKPYRSRTFPLGLKPGLSYDNISELIAYADGEDYK